MEKIRKSLQEIVDLCGFNVARDLVRAFPGVKIYIPKSGANAAVDQLDPKVKEAICTHFAGEYIEVPKTIYDDTESLRNIAISLRQEGLGNAQIAIKLEITERYLRKLLKGVPRKKVVDARQIDLEDYLTSTN
ncbi:hypothetical protein RYZ26_15390 [Terasakiella sp. A23]|uniref:hypothetical protein n=1 Tax=Terasakiella sp. FCG-A23 TaxID=3080561 RepID=UPI002953E88A|nr:hypothetical protein [Terasakiella sp. A23]MDV7340989.1 hypothetical protein [Terasakiella sp. A23]